MILNLYISGLYTLNQILLFISLVWFFNYNNFYINVWDIYSRTLGNELYINLYYFLWTSFWYIPLLITIIVIWQLTNRFYLKIFTVTLFLVFIIMNIIFDIHLYWALNTNPYKIYLTSDYYNNLLLNSINKYHPGLLYWSSLTIVSYWFVLNFLSLDRNLCFVYNFFEFSMIKTFLWSSLVLAITLALGGWWALQEGSWGGWWNWDPSEVFGLLILFFYISRLHKSFGKQNFYKNFISDLTFFIFLFQIYFFTQLNFDLVSHNFGTKIDNFIDNTNLYTFLIILSFVYLVLLWIKNFCLYRTFLIKIHTFHINLFNQFQLYGFIILLVFSYEIIYSLIPLFNDFLWKILNINIANYILVFEKYNLQIFYLIIIYFFKYNQYSILLVLLTYWSYWTVLLVYLSLRLRSHFFFHWVISLFFWLSLLSFSYILTSWNLNSSSLINSFELNQKSITQNLLNFNNLSLDYTISNYLNGYLGLSWNTIWFDTTVEVYSFSYSLLKDISNQAMSLGTNIFPFQITINDVLSLNLLVIFSQLCLIYIYHFFLNKQIIF